MSYWGKLVGGVIGSALGPFGAMLGMALGHAADEGVLRRLSFADALGGAGLHPARLTAMLGGKHQLFSMGVIVLSAKLAKVDGPVVRAEIEAFRRQFRIPAEQTRDVGRLFDQARESAEGYEPYAEELGRSFADNRGTLTDVLSALFIIARADKALTVSEQDMLRRIHQLFGLDAMAWDQARGAAARPTAEAEDAYAVLGTTRGASVDELRRAWLRLIRENHPDGLAARGVPEEFIARANEKVARINAAWDRIKRERGL